ncbi:MAG: hypothetical protein F6J87_05345 [Spirulina sp. SIO3F2]|nr:hypothetical protein [Spirulina sp. SIO3F2]
MKILTFIVTVLAVLALPAAFIAALFHPNKYLAQGIRGAVECDTPGVIIFFAVLSYVVYGLALGVYGFGWQRQRSRLHLVGFALCLAILMGMFPNTKLAFQEEAQMRQPCEDKFKQFELQSLLNEIPAHLPFAFGKAAFVNRGITQYYEF